MSINHKYVNALLEIANSSSAANSAKKIWRKELEKYRSSTIFGPKSDTASGNRLLRVNLEVMLEAAESIFGPAEMGSELYTTPGYHNEVPNSGIKTTLESPPRLMLIINQDAVTWEDAFYEIAHEVIHLLSPVIAEGGKPPVATLDEGVAVYFAEYVYEKYISSYTGSHPSLSPRGLGPNHRAYANAYALARKLNFEELRRIRDEFSGFPYATDPYRLLSLSAGKLNIEEARSLSAIFEYKRA